MIIAILAYAVAVVAAVRGLWSPCGLSVLSSLNPLSESVRGRRWAPTAAWYVTGAILGGAVLGLVCAAAAAVVAISRLPVADRIVIALAVAAAAVCTDCSTVRGGLPVVPRQVDERWLVRYRRWVYAAGFGVQIGSGFTTYVMTGASYLMMALAPLTGHPLLAGGVGLCFGTVRGLGVLLTGRVREAAGLRALLARVDRFGPASLRAARRVSEGAGVVLLAQLIRTSAGLGPAIGGASVAIFLVVLVEVREMRSVRAGAPGRGAPSAAASRAR